MDKPIKPAGPVGHPVGSGFGEYRNALLDYRQNMPHYSYDPTLDASHMQQATDFRQQMADYRQQRPMLQNYLTGFFGQGGPAGGQPPVMQPGVTGAPLPGAPMQQPVQLPPAMPQQVTVQGAIPALNPFQFPTY